MSLYRRHTVINIFPYCSHLEFFTLKRQTVKSVSQLVSQHLLLTLRTYSLASCLWRHDISITTKTGHPSGRYSTCYWLCIHIPQSHGFEDTIYPSPQSQSQTQISYVMNVLWVGHCGTTPLWEVDLLQGSVYTQSGLSLHLSDPLNSVNRRTRNHSLCTQKHSNYHAFSEVLFVCPCNQAHTWICDVNCGFCPFVFSTHSSSTLISALPHLLVALQV